MSWGCFLTSAIATAFSGLFLMAVGFAIPFWVSFVVTDDSGTKKQDFSVYLGVWYLMACIKGESNSCSSEPIEPKFNTSVKPDFKLFKASSAQSVSKNGHAALARFDYWWALQITSTIALGFVLLSALILLCCKCAGIHSRGFFTLAGMLLAFGGSGALGISIAISVGLGKTFGLDIVLNGETFPWSLLLFGLGSLMVLVAAFMVLVSVCCWSRYGGESHEENGYKNNDPTMLMTSLSQSYDRTRQPAGSYDYREYDRENRYEKSMFSKSKKYRDTTEEARDYPRGYATGESRDYRGSYQTNGNPRDYPPADYRVSYPPAGYRDEYGRSTDKGYSNRGYVENSSPYPYTASQSNSNLYRGYSPSTERF